MGLPKGYVLYGSWTKANLLFSQSKTFSSCAWARSWNGIFTTIPIPVDEPVEKHLNTAAVTPSRRERRAQFSN